MADRSGLIFAVIIFLLIASSSGPRPLTENERDQLHSFIEWKEAETRLLTLTHPGTSLKHVNLTNAAAAAPPKEFVDAIETVWTEGNHNTSAFYRNVSSYLHGTMIPTGKFEPHKMPPSPLFRNLVDDTKPTDLEQMHNVRISIHEPTPNRVGAVLVADGYHMFDFQGVHLEHGRLFMTTDSIKFSGHKALPWLLPASTPAQELETAYNVTVARANRSTNAVVKAEDIKDLEEAASDAKFCELVFIGHVHESTLSHRDLDDIEDELTDPQARPIKRERPLQISGILYSPDCGMVFNFNLTGEHLQKYDQRVREVCVAVMLSLLAFAIILGAQMNATSTPSMLSRVSLWTISSMSLVDGWICVMTLTMSFGSALGLTLLAVSFVAFALTSMFELRYLVMIYKAQLTERAANARVEGLPTTEVPEVPEERALASKVYTRYYITLLGFLFVTILSMDWSDRSRRLFEWVILVTLYSNWVPQILLNVRRGHQTVLLPSFIIGSAALRLFPALYFCFYSKNVGYHYYAPALGWTLLSWQWLQVLVLISQHFFGPRFFLPAHIVAPVYDYHPILTTDIEHGLNAEEPPVTETAGESTPMLDPEENGVVKQVSCAICMNPVDLIICEEGVPPGPAALVARRNYMVTPCRHIYHTGCLEEWMQSQLQCPICRNPLPPI